MDIRELHWLRTHAAKLDPELKSHLLTCYRKIAKAPCFLQRIYRFFQHRLRRFPVIIQLTPTRNYEAIKELRTTLAKYNKTINNLTIINSLATSLSLRAIKKITTHSLIKKIYLDQEIRALLHTAIPTTKATTLWQHNFTGKGVTIAIMDTGISSHPDLLLPQNRVLAFKDFVNKQTTSYDDNGHGTHCAGSAAGNGYASAGKYKGPAHEAKIVSLKILNKMGLGKSSTAIEAVEWILAYKKKFNIKIISLSLGYKATVSYREDPLCQALEKAWQAGIVICTAAGNDGPENKTINSPGIHPDFITVGAFDDHNTIDPADDTIAEFSSRGPTLDGLTKPDFLLPGHNIISARAKGSFLDKLNQNEVVDDWYLSLSGTSMAVPLCAGIIAQLLEAKPFLSPSEIKKQLRESCQKIFSADANVQGNGCLNCSKLLNQQTSNT
ncbi:MAG TPA: S8 family peptidase [Clostridia bacterium]|jgi:serine protease AprX|nr:S8 family peptidase [Clostridia bacterium]